MSKFLFVIAILSATLLLACSAVSDRASSVETSAPEPAPFSNQSLDSTIGQGAAAIEMAPGLPDEFMFMEPEAAEFSKAGGVDFEIAGAPPADGGTTSPLQTAQRRVISNASLSVEVEVVEAAIDQVRAIAEGVGGFVEHLSSFGSAENQQANMTVRVPQDQFTSAVERIADLGEVQNRNLGSEDVSEQFIDLEARLKSALREEESLLSLLERANQVNEILTIERELSRVRSEIERLQGQLNFLERRVDLATISVALFPPGQRLPDPPGANLAIAESKVSGRVDEVKNLVDTLGGEIDRVFRSTRDGRERADVSFRVFPKDFGQAMTVLESEGEIIFREVREGSSTANESEAPKEPNARIDVTFTEPESSTLALVLWIVLPIVGVLVVIGLGVAFFLTYQAGRNRRDRFMTA